MSEVQVLSLAATGALLLGIAVLLFAAPFARLVAKMTGLRNRGPQYIRMVGAIAILMAIVLAITAVVVATRS